MASSFHTYHCFLQTVFHCTKISLPLLTKKGIKKRHCISTATRSVLEIFLLYCKKKSVISIAIFKLEKKRGFDVQKAGAGK